MKVPLQDLSRGHQEIKQEIEDAILGVANSGRYILGPEVSAFEESLANYMGAGSVVSCASGTDAILLALAALEVGPGDEVVTSPFSFFSTAATIVRLGAKPVFADIDGETLTLSSKTVRSAVTPRTKVILPVHLYGQPSDMNGIRGIAEEIGARVVEDCAQAIGATYGEEVIGTCGDIGCFSFYPTKNLGAFGDAGATSTNDGDLAGRIRLLRVHGSDDAVEHSVVGVNSRLDTIQAAILDVKLRYLDVWNEARRVNASRYDEAFSDLPVVCPVKEEGCQSVYHQYTIRSEDRDGLLKHLGGLGIGTGVYYKLPLHLQPCFSDLGYKPGDFSQAEAAAREVLSIPVFAGLDGEEIQHVIQAVRSFFGK